MVMAQSLGFSESRRSDIGIVVTELATNTLLHAQSGELLICPFDGPDGARLDLLALDSGSGIADMTRALEDGFSTIGTAGQGFGAIRRISDEASVYSVRERGTVVWARFGKESSLGVASIPIQGETACGDSWLVLPGQARSLYMLVDGLGHGDGAQEAADEAVLVVRRYAEESPAEILARTHDALKKTRGAAMSIAVVDHDRRTVTYGGVGNVSGSLAASTGTRNMVSQNGTLGAALGRVQEYSYPLEPGSTLLMFSDGLTSKCSLNGYSGLQNRPAQLIAGLLFRDFSRKRDDATVLLARLGGDRT
jgi:anti-sigma regulatory factor (Ser/Thr protein kinase)/serine/threonine protein phosphatase PrpC